MQSVKRKKKSLTGVAAAAEDGKRHETDVQDNGDVDQLSVTLSQP